MPPESSDGITVLKAIEADQRNKTPRASMRSRLRHAGDLEREGDIVDDGAPRKCRFLLEHHADRGVRAGYGFAGDGDPAP
jgi:hypothetical protein